MTDNGKQWLTVTEACDVLGTTERTIRRQIKDDKYPSKMENGRRYVLVETPSQNHHEPTHGVKYDLPSSSVTTPPASDTTDVMSQMQDEIQFLRGQLTTRDRQIERLEVDRKEQLHQLTHELSEFRHSADDASKRHDTIILTITQQLDRATDQLEDLRSKKSWWKQVFGK